ncbi:hypothetical protein SP5_018_00490 [Sphingomonas parapaucimobilis NBRC 15100]|uniref:Uncharacterized protein n=1 Tax=Sphingomonas parapaucimobilis NBRC 15100 TaxID=1219049 RepID=A0A0A1W532_9SPHN|nr:hypothetical protein SP5_018_00490 [Sphingomonas parapaucimobilis NBRC 15100]
MRYLEVRKAGNAAPLKGEIFEYLDRITDDVRHIGRADDVLKVRHGPLLEFSGVGEAIKKEGMRKEILCGGRLAATLHIAR